MLYVLTINSEFNTSTPTGPHYVHGQVDTRNSKWPKNSLRYGNILSMLQQQQATLQSILAGQQVIQEKQAVLERKVSDIEREMSTSQATSSDANSSPPEKRKQIVSRELSVS